jgi:hypothetical protein
MASQAASPRRRSQAFFAVEFFDFEGVSLLVLQQ